MPQTVAGMRIEGKKDYQNEIREIIVAREPIRKLKDAARRNGTHYLRDVAMRLVQSGITTLDEANRVTFVA